MIRNSLFYLSILAIMLSISSCRTGGGDVMPDSATFPDAETTSKGIIILQKAFGSHDPRLIASQFSYPILRQYPLKDIPDSATMVKYYTTIVDDSLEEVIVNTPPSEWHSLGWRGWSPGEGTPSIWWDGKIYEVPYQSKKERHIREQLIKRDIETLTPELRSGWRPYYCLMSPDTHTIYRIDIAEGEEERDSAILRLTAFPTRPHKGMHPKMQLKGRLRVEGTAGNRSLHFYSDNVNADYTMDRSDDSSPRLVFFAPNDTSIYFVRPMYWLDIVTDSI